MDANNITFSHDTVKTVASLMHIISKVRGAGNDLLYASRLLYITDKYHLAWYGRTVTGDQYICSEGGPIGKIAHNISICWEASLDRFYRSRFHSEEDIDEYLSESDREALSFAINNFSKMARGRFYDYMRELPEWKKNNIVSLAAEQEDNGAIPQISLNDMLLMPEGDCYFNISEEHLAESRRIAGIQTALLVSGNFKE